MFEVLVNKTEAPAQIGDWGEFVNVGVGIASIFMVLIISETIWQKSGLTASNFISQQPGIVTTEEGIVKSNAELIHVLFEGTNVKEMSPGLL